jgi:hypothetical protein
VYFILQCVYWIWCCLAEVGCIVKGWAGLTYGSALVNAFYGNSYCLRFIRITYSGGKWHFFKCWSWWYVSLPVHSNGGFGYKSLSLYVTHTSHISVRTCCGHIAVFVPFAQHMARSWRKQDDVSCWIWNWAGTLGTGFLPIYVRLCFLEGSQVSPVCAAGKRAIRVGQRRGGVAALFVRQSV